MDLNTILFSIGVILLSINLFFVYRIEKNDRKEVDKINKDERGSVLAILLVVVIVLMVLAYMGYAHFDVDALIDRITSFFSGLT